METIFPYLKVALASACLASLMSVAAAQTVEGTPAMIPHDTSSYQITPDMNACVMCHRQENSMAGAKNIPVSHFTGTDGTKEDAVTKARYFCTACHAPETPEQ